MLKTLNALWEGASYTEANRVISEMGDAAPFVLASRFEAELNDPRRTVGKVASCVFVNAVALAEHDLKDDYGFVRFTSSAPLRRFTNVVDAATVAAMGSPIFDVVTMQQLFHVLCFHRAGRKTFQVAPDLGRELLETHTKGLLTGDLHAPYEAFRIWVPPELGFRIWVGGTGWHDLIEVHVVRDVSPQRSGWRILLHGAAQEGASPFDNAITFHGLFDEAGLPLDKLVANQQKLLAEHNEGYANDKDDTLVTILRWTINVILYITCQNAEREHRYVDQRTAALVKKNKTRTGKAKTKIEKQLRTMDRRQVIYLGASVRHVRRADAAGTRLHRVAGHMHGYWTGDGLRKLSRAEREAKRSELFKVQWTAPYWKGAGDESNPIVLVGKRAE